MKIEKEDFEQWQAHPVTEEVMRALRVLAERAKQKWIETSWDGMTADPLMLADLKAVHRTANDLSELKFEELEEALNDDQE